MALGQRAPYAQRMTSPMVPRLCLTGLTLGLMLMLAAPLAGDLGGLARGYGLLVVLTALYALGGLGLRRWFASRDRQAACVSRQRQFADEGPRSR